MRPWIASAVVVIVILSASPSWSLPVQWPGNGHYYEYFLSPVTWPAACGAARAISYMGMTGHLATITSSEEDSFIVNTVIGPSGWDPTGHVWIGGYQPPGSDEPNAGWAWSTGESWTYTNWSGPEPNNGWDGQGDEDCLAISGNGPGLWNDNCATQCHPYLVEYEDGVPGACPDVTLACDDMGQGCTADIIQFSSVTYSVWEDSGPATITVIRSGPGSGSVSVDYATGDSTALAGQDYISSSGTISFADGDLNPKTFNVSILNDPNIEGDEVVNLFLSNPTGGAVLGAPARALLTIEDDESHGRLAFSGAYYDVREDELHAVVTIIRTGGKQGVVTVSCATSDGTALSGSDYMSTYGIVSFAPGDILPKTFRVHVFNDTQVEGTETVLLTLSNPTGGATLGIPNTATLEITDDDPAFIHVPGGGPKILLHLASPTSKNRCTRTAAAPPCEEAVVTGNLYPQLYYAYVLVAGADASAGVAGTQFGIEYDAGVNIYGWELCATLEFQSPEGWGGSQPPPAGGSGGGGRKREEVRTSGYSTPWPQSGSGNMITWDPDTKCQRTEPGGVGTGVVAVAGYFYVAAYSPSRLSIIPRPADGLAKIGDCAALEVLVEPACLGSVGFGGAAGLNPCSPPAAPACSASDDGAAVVVSWTDVPGATHYYVFRDGDPLVETLAGVTSFIDAPPAGSYLYAVKAWAGSALSAACQDTGRVSGVGEETPAPGGFRLLPPATPTAAPAIVSFELPSPGSVELAVFGVSGRLVQVLADGPFGTGRHSLKWDGRDVMGRQVASGLYFIRMNAGAFVGKQRIVLLR